MFVVAPATGSLHSHHNSFMRFVDPRRCKQPGPGTSNFTVPVHPSAEKI